MTKLCVFDFDGTLVDTREFIVQAFEYTLAKHGLEAHSREDILSKIGKPLNIDYQTITGLSDTEELCATHRSFQNEHQDLVVLFPGIRETLLQLRERGIKIVVSTTGSKLTSVASMEQVGILGELDLVLSVEDVIAPRPDPDCIRKSMEQFSLLPEHTVMIGDRAIDIEAGKNIGVTTVGVLYGAEGEKINNSHPDYKIEEISQLLSIIK